MYATNFMAHKESTIIEHVYLIIVGLSVNRRGERKCWIWECRGGLPTILAGYSGISIRWDLCGMMFFA
jgi:hypothetical protein